MKALSIRQPWAWAVASGIKDVENRTWRTNFRGQVAIHAGKAFAYDHRTDKEQNRFWHDWGFKFTSPRQAIIGVVDVVGCVPAQECESDWANVWEGGPSFCFLLKNAKLFEFPIPCKGQLGFYDLNPILMAAINVQLQEMESR